MVGSERNKSSPGERAVYSRCWYYKWQRKPPIEQYPRIAKAVLFIYAVKDNTDQVMAGAGGGENQAAPSLGGKAGLDARHTSICRE